MDFEKVTDILICPICKEICLPPIYQCEKGHILCHNCIPLLKDNLCPTCRVALPFEKIRALALEQLAETIEVKCKHWNIGCHSTFSIDKVQAHLQFSNCIYEPLNLCHKFGSICKALVSIVDLKEHCLKAHGNSTLKFDEGTIRCDIAQSVKLNDLKDVNNNEHIDWEPCFIVTWSQVHVLLSKYLGSQKLFQWTLVTLTDTFVNHDSALSTHRVLMTTGLQAEFSNFQTTWVGTSLQFDEYRKECQDQEGANEWSPKVTFSLPLRCFTFHQPLAKTDRNRIIKWNLSLTISQSPINQVIHEMERNLQISCEIDGALSNGLLMSHSYQKKSGTINSTTGPQLRPPSSLSPTAQSTASSLPPSSTAPSDVSTYFYNVPYP